MNQSNHSTLKSNQPIQIELNGFLSGLFILWIVVASIISIVQSVMIFQLGIDNGIAIGIYNLLTTILGITGTCGMYKKRRWGLFLIGIFFFIQFVFCLYLDNSVIGYSNEAIKVLIRLVILSALLCLRKDGHSAWKAIWNNGVLKPTIQDQPYSSGEQKKATESKATEPTENEVRPEFAEQESNRNNDDLPDDDKNQKHDRLRIKISNSSKNLLIGVLLSAIFVVLSIYVTSFVVSVNKQSYPEYVNSFYAKILYHYGKPNNALFKDLVFKAKAAHEENMSELEQYYYQAALDIGTNKDELLIEIGNYYFNNNKFKDACELYQKMQNQEMDGLQEKLAWSYFKIGESDYAIRSAQNVLLKDPQNTLAIKTLYHAYWRRENWSKCILWADKHIAQAPTSARPYYIKSCAQYKSGLVDDAKETYKKAVSLEPNDPFAISYAYIIGAPFSILSVNLVDVGKEQNLEKYYRRIVLIPRLTISPKRLGACELILKVLDYSTGENYQLNAYSQVISISEMTNQTIDFTAFGFTEDELKTLRKMQSRTFV